MEAGKDGAFDAGSADAVVSVGVGWFLLDVWCEWGRVTT